MTRGFTTSTPLICRFTRAPLVWRSKIQYNRGVHQSLSITLEKFMSQMGRWNGMRQFIPLNTFRFVGSSLIIYVLSDRLRQDIATNYCIYWRHCLKIIMNVHVFMECFLASQIYSLHQIDLLVWKCGNHPLSQGIPHPTKNHGAIQTYRSHCLDRLIWKDIINISWIRSTFITNKIIRRAIMHNTCTSSSCSKRAETISGFTTW